MCHVKWYEVWAYRLRNPNGGGGDRPHPFISSRSGQALCCPRIAEIPLQGLASAVALVLCIHTGVSELLGRDEWGVFFSFRKGILCVQKMGRNNRSRDNRGTAFAYHERLPSAKLGWVETGGTHQSDRARKGRVYVKVGIIVAVTGGSS